MHNGAANDYDIALAVPTYRVSSSSDLSQRNATPTAVIVPPEARRKARLSTFYGGRWSVLLFLMPCS